MYGRIFYKIIWKWPLKKKSLSNNIMGVNVDKLAEIYFILDHLDRQDLMDFLQEEYDDPSYTTEALTKKTKVN